MQYKNKHDKITQFTDSLVKNFCSLIAIVIILVVRERERERSGMN